LREIHRVLKPGGNFLLIEPLRDLRGLFLFTNLRVLEAAGHGEMGETAGGAGFCCSGLSYRGGMGLVLCGKAYI
jgi:SAM-dependent methyltransferase